MYKRHKTLSVILFFTSFIIGMVLNLNYSSLADAAITVISIALAVIISVPAALLGSHFSKSLKAVSDKEKPTKSMLGVLAAYLRVAGFCCILTIAISSVYLLEPDTSALRTLLSKNYELICQTASALSLALFAYNIFLMWLILKYLITAMLNAALL